MSLFQEETSLMVEVLLQGRLGLLVGAGLWRWCRSLSLKNGRWRWGWRRRWGLNLDFGLGGKSLGSLEH